MPNLDRPNGLVPTQTREQTSTNGQIQQFDVDPAYATVVRTGDPVQLAAAGRFVEVSDGSVQLLGVVVGIVEDETVCETTFPAVIPASTGGRVFVNTSPSTLYEVQQLATDPAYTALAVGQNANVAVDPAVLPAQQERTGLSAFVLSGALAPDPGPGLVKIVEVQESPVNSPDEVAGRYIVKLNMPETPAV